MWKITGDTHTHMRIHIPLLELISEFNNAVGHTLKKLLYLYIIAIGIWKQNILRAI